MGSTSRVIITVALCAGILLIWQVFFAPKPPPPGTTATSGAASGSTPAESPSASGSGSTSQPAASQPAAAPVLKRDPRQGPVVLDREGKKTELQIPSARVAFSDRGATLRHWVLRETRYKEVRGGKLQQVDLVQTQQGKGPWQLTTTFPQSDFEVPEDARFTLQKQQDKEVIYHWASSKVRVTKHYLLDRSRPSVVWLDLQVENLTEARLRGRLEVGLHSQQDPGQKAASFTNPYPQITTGLCYVNGELHRRSSGAITGEDSGCSAAGCGMGSGPVTQTGEVFWIGSDDRYFLTALVPQDKNVERRCELKLLEGNVVQSSLLYPESSIEPGKSARYRFAVFVGPKDLKEMDTVGGAGEMEIKLGEAIEFGWFAVLCRPMLWLMKIFYSWFGNWGLAIILLTIVVKLITLYWTQKSMRSMKEMQRLKPKIDALKTKFKDDKQRFNQEMMALYKLHKVNPLGGCLPMLIQMPVWFALYRTLGNAVELYRSSFAGWITDLTAPDPYYVLPIAMGIAMYAQQAITPQPLEGAQAKMMKYFMPGMFTVMMLWLPAGLTLYIFVNTVLTMVHQWYMNRTDAARAPKVEEKGKEPVRPPERSGERGRRPKRRPKNR